MMRGTYTAIGSLCIAGIVSKVVLICLEKIPKKSLLLEKCRDAPLETTSRKVNRTDLLGLKVLFCKGSSSAVFLHDLSRAEHSERESMCI